MHVTYAPVWIAGGIGCACFFCTALFFFQKRIPLSNGDWIYREQNPGRFFNVLSLLALTGCLMFAVAAFIWFGGGALTK